MLPRRSLRRVAGMMVMRRRNGCPELSLHMPTGSRHAAMPERKERQDTEINPQRDETDRAQLGSNRREA
jgi:hypothetical protein